jgi:hypothetical protein
VPWIVANNQVGAVVLQCCGGWGIQEEGEIRRKRDGDCNGKKKWGDVGHLSVV